MKRRTFVQFAVSASGIVILDPTQLLAKKPNEDSMKVTMIYNNIGESDVLESAWGLSIWVEDKKEAILFDTGGDAKIIMENLGKAKVDFNKLSKIVISHNHWDHKNGLAKVLEITNNKPEVYVADHEAQNFKDEYPNAKIKGVRQIQKLTSNISTTAQLVDLTGQNKIYELSLVVHHNDSLYLITGCSHSGIVEMVEHVKETYPNENIELVTGGFHLRSKPEVEVKKISRKLKELGVLNLAASHCTGDQAIVLFKKDWGEHFIDFNLGDIRDI